MATREWNISFAVLLSILFHNGALCQLRMTPENTADVVGSSVVLECQGSVNDPLGGIFWYELITSTTLTPLIYNGNPVDGAPNSQLYSITGDSSVAQYHLNIELAFLSGGRYQCGQPSGDISASSHVTVLESAPVCDNTIQEDGFVEESETITYTCEVNYNSTSINWPPVMTWTGPDGTIPEVSKVSTSQRTVTSTLEVTGAPGLNGAVYSVQTHFEAYVGSLPPGHATNVPTYNHTYSLNALQVYYSPRDIAFQPCGNTFNPGDRLTCSAVGNPTVSYIWYNSTDNSTLADSAELTITVEMDGLTCSCEPYNTIRGTKHSISKEITLTVNEATEPATTEATEPATTEALSPCICSGPSSGVVAGILIAILLLLGLLVVSSLLLWRTRNTHCEKCTPKLNPHHPEKSNSCNGVYETPNPIGITGQPSEYTELSFT